MRGNPRLVAPGTHVCSRDSGKRRDRRAAGLLPKRRMGNIDVLVRIQRHGNFIDAGARAIDQRGKALHVGVRAGDRQRRAQACARVLRQRRAPGIGQIAKIILRVDN